jgi:hypothetical protein
MAQALDKMMKSKKYEAACQNVLILLISSMQQSQTKYLK